MEIKTKLFLFITYIISYVCFNFNKVLREILVLVCTNIYDTSVPVIGPYMRAVPIDIKEASLDGVPYTNKMKLIINWYWDGDINGISMSDLLVNGDILRLRYIIKTSHTTTMKCCTINIKNNTINGDDILFGELDLVKYKYKD